MELRVARAEHGTLLCRTRLPFRFGVHTLTAAPLLTLCLEVEGQDGRRVRGAAADLAMPRWFSKDPARSPEQDIRDLQASLAGALASVRHGSARGTAFDLWLLLHRARVAPAPRERRLVEGFGVALVERALIDAACRLGNCDLAGALEGDLLGFRPAALHPGLGPWRLAPARPSSIGVRHTVGLVDALTPEEARPRIEDGLPECLAEDIARYGLTRFKVKLGGDARADRERLVDVARVVEEAGVAEPVWTVDGNEQYAELEPLVRMLESLAAEPVGARFLARLRLVEQPLPRALTLDPAAAPGLAALARIAPPLLDEGDADPETFSRAVQLGWRGVSVKNCKGVFRALALRGLCEADARLFQSGEDLTNLPVLSLQQDLATAAVLGLEDVERNGHHYFRGLDHLPPREARAALALHPRLYAEVGGCIQLRIEDGRVDISGLGGPGYGGEVELDLAARREARA